jgi:hypothetical protein
MLLDEIKSRGASVGEVVASTPPNFDVAADGLLGRASRFLRSPQLNAVPFGGLKAWY